MPQNEIISDTSFAKKVPFQIANNSGQTVICYAILLEPPPGMNGVWKKTLFSGTPYVGHAETGRYLFFVTDNTGSPLGCGEVTISITGQVSFEPPNVPPGSLIAMRGRNSVGTIVTVDLTIPPVFSGPYLP